MRTLFSALTLVTDTFGEMLGPDCEVVLHDLRRPTSSVVHVVNGHVTGRSVGQGIRDLLGIVQSPRFRDDRLVNYTTRMPDGRVVKSTTMIFRDEKGEIIAAICVNHDIQALVAAASALQQMCQVYDKASPAPFPVSEPPPQAGVESVTNTIISQTVQGYGALVNRMTKEDKLEVIRFLDDKGAFLVKGAIERVAQELGVSRSSIYKYLEEIRSQAG